MVDSVSSFVNWSCLKSIVVREPATPYRMLYLGSSLPPTYLIKVTGLFSRGHLILISDVSGFIHQPGSIILWRTAIRNDGVFGHDNLRTLFVIFGRICAVSSRIGHLLLNVRKLIRGLDVSMTYLIFQSLDEAIKANGNE